MIKKTAVNEKVVRSIDKRQPKYRPHILSNSFILQENMTYQADAMLFDHSTER